MSDMQTCNMDERTNEEKLLDKNAELCAALKKYGTHGWDCRDGGNCNCGLSEALTKVGAA